ncbi:MAG TPA: (d)CMP kinase [Anaerolineae bacterium]
MTAGEVQALRTTASQAAHRARHDQPSDLERETVPLVPSTIAIDGPAASGKSTIGGRIAAELAYLYFDTGVMYRALTWAALLRRIPIGDEEAVTRLAESVKIDVLPPEVDDGRDVTVLLDGADITWDIRRPEVDKAVSPVSAYRGVREVMRREQRRIGLNGRVIMVGRDIGTVVLPEADLKIYLDASLPERAHRRWLERKMRGQISEEPTVLEELRRRDEIDSSREHAPLSVAKDAILIDSTEMGIAEVVGRVKYLIERWGQQQAATRQAPPRPVLKRRAALPAKDARG